MIAPLFLQATAPVAAPPADVRPQCNTDDEGGEWEMDSHGCRTRRRRRWEPGSLFGVRVGITNVHGSDSDGTFVGAMASLQTEQFKAGPGRILSGHSSFDASLGGGSAGLEGGLGGLLTIGARAPFGRTHGPFARIGFAGELLGNKRFYYSHLDLPVGEVGYQYSSANTVAELGGRGAADLTGRYDTGVHTRRATGDGDFMWAIYAALHSAIGRIDISWTTTEAKDFYPGGTISDLRAKGCIYMTERLAACVDMRYLDGRAYMRNLPLPPVVGDASTVYGGVTVGFVDL